MKIKPERFKITPYIKSAASKVVKSLIILPFAFLAYDYYKSRDIRSTAKEAV